MLCQVLAFQRDQRWRHADRDMNGRVRANFLDFS